MEVTVYGVTRETYERVTRRPGSYTAFMRGLNLLQDGGVRVRLKAMALRSNQHELVEIARFCRERTKDYFRFDPQLHLRVDRDPLRNEEIKAERLTPEEVVALELADDQRFESMQKGCDTLIMPSHAEHTCNHLFHCGTGNGSFEVGFDGTFRLCDSLRGAREPPPICARSVCAMPGRTSCPWCAICALTGRPSWRAAAAAPL